MQPTPSTETPRAREGVSVVATVENPAQRYALRSELARGGMGRIWIADDARLARRVAIKELLDASSMQRARFDRELALTSRLEHPSIVSIQDGGTWSDGRPFYVMRLVTGESLDQTIARASSVAERIALLSHALAAVDALAYAHAQGIVHRDLKPENVLVGDFGETVVIDWGLAKDLRAVTPELVGGPGRELARVGETLGGEVLGTPAYMPPEQALGDAVDERADVYALGAILYHLLSGARPYRGSSAEAVLANVISAPPTALATCAPAAPPDLVAIVDKAMARQPGDRYRTAAELAVDLKRFQAGQLVGAHHYSGAQLARRWVRTHRGPVVVAALAAIALATVGAVSVRRIVREEHVADAARTLADENRQRADERRVAAEALVTYTLGDLADDLEPLGKLALLEQPARRALAYFDEQRDLAPDEQLSHATALRDLGRALVSRGEMPAAEAKVRAALAETRGLAGSADPIEGHVLGGGLHADLGDLLVVRGAVNDAIVEYRAAVAAFAAVTRARPGDKRGARAEKETHEKLADELLVLHDVDGAERELREALAIARARIAAAPADLEAQLDLVGPEHAMGDARAARGDAAGALATYRATLDRIAPLHEQRPDDTTLARMIELTQHRIGVQLLAQHDVPGALVALHAAVTLAGALVAHDPENRGWQYDRALMLGRLGEALRTASQPAAAIAAFREGIAIMRSFAARDPSLAVTDRLLFEIDLAELLREHGQPGPAELEAREAVAIGEQASAKAPHDRQRQLDLGDAYAGLDAALLALHRPGDAVEIASRALTRARAVVAEWPDDVPGHYYLEQALVDAAAARCAAGARADAHATYDEAVALADRFVAATPDDANWHDLDRDARDRAKACPR